MLNKAIKEIIIIHGILKNLSPLSVGSGLDDQSDHDVIKSWDGIPYIPATTLTGVLRHSLLTSLNKKDNLYRKVERLFGEVTNGEKETGKAIYLSSLISYDAYPMSGSKFEFRVRDGVKVDYQTRTADKGSKYDFEVIEPGVDFDFKMEFHLNEKDEDYYTIIKMTLDLFKAGYVHIGSKANRGLGRIQLSDEKIYRFNVEKKEDLLAFINGPEEWKNFEDSDFSGVAEKRIPSVLLKAYFTIPYSVIIRSYNIEPDSPDASHIQSAGKDVIPGTSWTGALRHALNAILEELDVSEKIRCKHLNELFGKVDEKKKDAFSSTVRIYESEIKNGKRLVYTRNKIDRFTGGVVESALFDEEAVYQGETELVIDLSRLAIQKKEDYEGYVGLLLLAIRDMGNGIQPIGGDANIGRGILQLKKVKLNGEEIPIEDNTLKYYIKAAELIKKGEENGDN